MDTFLKADSNKHRQRYDHFFFSAMAMLLLVTFFICFASSYYLAGIMIATGLMASVDVLLLSSSSLPAGRQEFSIGYASGLDIINTSTAASSIRCAI